MYKKYIQSHDTSHDNLVSALCHDLLRYGPIGPPQAAPRPTLSISVQIRQVFTSRPLGAERYTNHIVSACVATTMSVCKVSKKF